MRRATTITAVASVMAALVITALLRTMKHEPPPAAQPSRAAVEAERPAPPTDPRPVAPAAPAPKPEPTAQKPAAPAPEPLDEPSLMAQLRAVQDTDPALALELAREGNRRFPDSPEAAERAALAVKALARQGKLSEARGEAETMVRQYPDSPWALEVERHTGAHPHRNQVAPK